jgi:hypothetical protein
MFPIELKKVKLVLRKTLLVSFGDSFLVRNYYPYSILFRKVRFHKKLLIVYNVAVTTYKSKRNPSS